MATPAQMRGYLFEVIIKNLLSLNDFIPVENSADKHVKAPNKFEVSLRGRGTWHQIDALCIYSKAIPFVHDLRLLSEMKFYEGEIQKDKIRQFIGVVKDVSENYFVSPDGLHKNQPRYTDVGVFFSANGFQEEAENLAFAHGIKTVSYRNNTIVNSLKECIENIVARGELPASLFSNGNRTEFMEKVSNFLSDKITFFELQSRFRQIPDSIRESLDTLKTISLGVQSSFFGVTSSNFFLHFLGTSGFPFELFKTSDEAECRIYYEDRSRFYLTFGDNDYRKTANRYYFSAPKIMIRAVASRNRQEILLAKDEIFAKIKVSISTPEGIHRNLLLKIDKHWLQELKISIV